MIYAKYGAAAYGQYRSPTYAGSRLIARAIRSFSLRSRDATSRGLDFNYTCVPEQQRTADRVFEM